MDPDRIVVNVELKRRVQASRADLYVEIQGDSFITGNAVLKKADQVRRLSNALMAIGIEERAIEVMGVQATMDGGILAKSSSVTYRLRVELPTLDSIADAIGAVSSTKNSRLTMLDWQYAGIEEIHDAMLRQALESAEHRAALICSAMHHRIQGIHNLTEKLRDHEDVPTTRPILGMARMEGVGRGSKSPDLGIDVTHSKTLALEVRVEYRVQPQAAG